MAKFISPLVIFFSLFSHVFSIPGNYISNELLNNQILHEDLRIRSVSPVDSVDACNTLCQLDATCDVFSYSAFRNLCELYKMIIGSRSIPKNNFKLYVREKSTSEGYLKMGSDYVFFVHKLMTAYEGETYCNGQGGELMPIKNAEQNEILRAQIISKKAVFSTFIGITDETDEGIWKEFNGATASYTNFDWNGVWPRKDLNCAVMKITGKWKHTNCHNKSYFMCKIPMF